MATTTVVFKHTLHDSRIHNWNISRTNEDLARLIIAKYYETEDSQAPITKDGPFISAFKKASERHHALTYCSMLSCLKQIQAQIQHLNGFYKIHENSTPAGVFHHDHLSNTHFSEQTTLKQKHHLVGQSGITGLLISRLLFLKQHGMIHIRRDSQHAKKLARYIHSEFSSEILLGNRYFYRLPQLICADYPTQVVGSNNTHCKELIPIDQLSTNNINDIKSLLVELYQKHVGQLDLSINMFKRGMMTLCEIRENPNFVQLLTYFWYYTKALMKVQNQIVGFDNENGIKRIVSISDLCAIAVLVPRLFSYDVAHIFDNSNQAFIRFVKTTKETYIRLANEGSIAAFLAFAKVEPNMISELVAPFILDNLMGFNVKSHANFISKRDPVFGLLREKYAKHIPKFGELVILRSRDRFAEKYYPIHLQIEDVRTRGARREELMRVNRSSYNKK
jgi:hypothetical protein